MLVAGCFKVRKGMLLYSDVGRGEVMPLADQPLSRDGEHSR
jgi:hypothetical protein